jgi:hypothetical protein
VHIPSGAEGGRRADLRGLRALLERLRRSWSRPALPRRPTGFLRLNGAGTNTALSAGAQARSRPALPLFWEVVPEGGKGIWGSLNLFVLVLRRLRAARLRQSFQKTHRRSVSIPTIPTEAPKLLRSALSTTRMKRLERPKPANPSGFLRIGAC